MNLRIIFQYAKACNSYYNFQKIIAKAMFNSPSSADTSELTDKLFLTDGSDAVKPDTNEFTEWVAKNGWVYSNEFSIWLKGNKDATVGELYELFKADSNCPACGCLITIKSPDNKCDKCRFDY